MPFTNLGLHDYMLDSIKMVGYKKPTPIQEQSIPLILEGNDLIAEAQTGTGKTAAFALPTLQILTESERTRKKSNIQALVLTPTRELAVQVAQAIDDLGHGTLRKIRVLPIIGGENIEEQAKQLRFGFDVVVATPGRLLELVRNKQIRLLELKLLILDEADKMLDLGFADELEQLMESVPKERQTLLFSATFPTKVEALTQRVLRNPIHVSLSSEVPTIENVTQRVIEVNHENRGPLLRHLIETEDWQHVLIFVASKRTARNLTAKLVRDGILAAEFHGGLTQDERSYALRQFHNRNVRILVSTDLAARGIDVYKLPIVLNYELPRSPKDYIHRIGRTGRAGRAGVAVTFIGHEDQAHFSLIETRAKISLDRERIEGFELTGTPPPPKKSKAPVKGKRKSKKDKAREAAVNAASDDDSGDKPSS